MVSVHASSEVDLGFESRGGVKPKYYKIGICCFSAKYRVLRSKSKNCNQDNVSKWSDMYTRGQLFNVSKWSDMYTRGQLFNVSKWSDMYTRGQLFNVSKWSDMYTRGQLFQ